MKNPFNFAFPDAKTLLAKPFDWLKSLLFNSWTPILLLALLATTCLWRAMAPGKNMGDELAGKLAEKSPAFRHWYATLQTEKEKTAVAKSLDAYTLAYGSAVWIRHAEDELSTNGTPRYYDLVELAMSLEASRDRTEMLNGHEVPLSLLSRAGMTEFLARYVDDLKDLHEQGGKSWRAAKANPMAVGVRRATKEARGGEELWQWYLENHEWCNDYLSNIQWTGDEVDPDAQLLDVLRELSRRQKVYRNLRQEVLEAARQDEDNDGGLRELTTGDFLAISMATVAQFGEVFDVLAEEKAPLVEALDVMANNIADLSEAKAFDTPAECRKTGTALATIHRSHRAVWDLASGLNGEGVIRFYREVPEHAETVLDAFGEEGVVPFLRQYYASPELLSVATEVLARYEMAGWATLFQFRDNGEFKKALLAEGVGHLVVPYVAFKDDGKGGAAKAIGECLDDPGWVKRYLDKDGKIKEDEATFAELLPLVGGIATVLKHQLRGEPVTMEEIGWAAFDVLDTAVTAAAIVGTAGMATPAVTAKAAAKQTAKQGSKKAVRQAGKKLVKSGTRYALREGTENVSKNVLRQQAKAQVRRTLTRNLLKASAKKAVVRTVQFGSRTVKVAVRPLVAVGKAWNELPPPMKAKVMRGVAGAMMFVVLTQRTMPMLPGYMHQRIEDFGRQAGKIVHDMATTGSDTAMAALKAAVGIDSHDTGGATDRIVSAIVGAAALIGGLLLWKRRHAPPRRLT